MHVTLLPSVAKAEVLCFMLFLDSSTLLIQSYHNPSLLLSVILIIIMIVSMNRA